MPIAAADSTLAAIIQKVRFLTRSPSATQLTDAQIEAYVNTFVAYDFPEELRLFRLKTTFTWYCQPYKDVYSPSVVVNDPLYQFDQKYISFEPPLYIAGVESAYTQSRENFFRAYPMINNIANSGSVGNGVAVHFVSNITPVTPVPILRGQVTFSSIDINNNGLVAYDKLGDGNLYDNVNVAPIGTINYLTGAYDITFPVAPGVDQVIYAETVPYVPAQPIQMLYYENKFTLRPVPDKPYQITINAFIQPTQFLVDTTQSPQMQQWWQYIAYGAAKKVLEDRMDLETVDLIMPEFNRQERLCLRQSLVQQSNQRVPTIYTDQTRPSGSGWGPYGPPF